MVDVDFNPRTLRALLASGERLPLDRALALVRAVALAVDTLHAHQLVHGALSPGAVQVDGDDRVTLLPPGQTDDRVTLLPPGRTTDAVGGPDRASRAADVRDGAADGIDTARAYWSPQRRAGEPARHADDLYALGLIARAVLTGPPNSHAEPPLPTEIEAVLEAQLAWAPSGRFASGVELANELERAARQARGPEAGPDDTVPHAETARSEPEPAWAAARRVALAREAHRLALAELPQRHHRERMRTMAHHPVQRRDYPDFPLPGGWVAVLVVVLCSVYLFPLYFMLFPHG